MRAESSIPESVETADGVAIAAPVREIADSSRRSHLYPSRLPAASCTASRARDRSVVPGSYGL